MDTNNQVAIVTGASRGIGRAIALRLAADGFTVVVNYAGNTAKANEVVTEIEANGGKALCIQGDVADSKDVAHLFEATKKAFGRIDVVVNSAGIMPLTKIEEGNLEVFDKVIATNLRGAFLMMFHSAQHLDKGGRIVVLSSSVIAKSFPAYGPYIASKAGVEGLVHVFANEMRGREITVNAISPGPVATELFFVGKSEELISQIAKQAPFERIGEPHEIAAAVSFLVGRDGGWVNSQIIRVNGGFA